MAIKLNLLPPEQTVDKNLSAVLKAIRSFGIILLAAFLVFTVGVSAFFLISTLSLKSINTQSEVLSRQIAAQEQSEQKIVLLKDRLAKIMLVEKIPGSLNNLGLVNPIVSALPSDSSTPELDLDPQKIGLSVDLKSNSSMTQFFKNVAASTTFKTIVLSAFSYSPVNGYLASLVLTGK